MTKSHKRRLAKQQRGRPGGWLMRECEVLSSIPWTYRRRGGAYTCNPRAGEAEPGTPAAVGWLALLAWCA